MTSFFFKKIRQLNDELFENEIRVSYFNSKNEQLIQLADFVANTALRALNHGSEEAKENLELLTPLLTGGKVLEFKKNRQAMQYENKC